MSRRIPKIIAVTGVAAALAVGGAGVAQASPGPNQAKDQAAKSYDKKDRRSNDGSRDRHGNRDRRGNRDRHGRHDRHGDRDRGRDGSGGKDHDGDASQR